MKASVKLNEQGFESAEEYIEAELVPVVSQLKSIVSNPIEPSLEQEPKASNASMSLTHFDKQVIDKRVDASYNWESHNPIVNDKTAKVYAVISAGLERDGKPAVIQVHGSDSSNSVAYEVVSTGKNEKYLQLSPSSGVVHYAPMSFGEKCIMYSFRIETVYA